MNAPSIVYGPSPGCPMCGAYYGQHNEGCLYHSPPTPAPPLSPDSFLTKECDKCKGKGRIVDPSSFGAAARERRLAAGMTLRQVARAIGKSAPYLSDLEHGRRRWTPQMIADYWDATRPAGGSR